MVEGTTGMVKGCDTLGGTPLENGTSFRSANVEVLEGAAEVTLGCGGGASVTWIASGLQPSSRYVSTAGGDYCWVTMRAIVDHTTVIATNTWGFVFS
jgi:hypothetical protein